MAQERDVVKVGQAQPDTLSATERKIPTREEIRGKVVSVLGRNYSADRLNVDLPPNLHGEWVSNDKVDILRMQDMGFWIDTEYAPKRAYHSEGDKKAIIGDVIFMVTHKEVKLEIDRVKQEMYEREHGIKRDQKEERDYRNVSDKTLKEAHITPFIESSTQTASATEINAAIQS
jgi:hypothetical protein